MLSKGYGCYPHNETVKMNPNSTAGKEMRKPHACTEPWS